MKNLLYKEIRLCIPVQVWIFVGLSCLILIPSWPAMVAFVYPLSGFLSLFPTYLANRDLLYTATLPLEKKKVVLGKVLLLGFLELLSMLFSVPFGLVRVFFLNPMIPASEAYADLGVNLATYGFGLLGFALFNLIFVPLYYKSPDSKNVGATLLSYFVTLVFFGVVMAVFIAVPGASSWISSWSGPGLWGQIGIFAGGAILFFLLNALAYKLGSKSFQKIDL